jgi:hypothetical protein
MSNHSEPEFTQLRRLLVLKRHEQPPPGYFDFLAGQIQVTLRSSQAPQSPPPMGVLQRLLQRLETLQARPAFAVGVGGAFLGLLVGAVVLLESAEPATQPEGQWLTEISSQPVSTEGIMAASALDATPLLASNSPAAGGPSLFDLIQPPPTERAGMAP